MNQKPDNAESHTSKKLDSDVQSLISTITRHVTNLSRQTNPSDQGDSGIITLAGTNKGAIMKAEFTEDAAINNDNDFGEESMYAYTNSNYQAINNSILVDATFEAEDPGVHIEIVDCIDDQDEEEGKKVKGKKKEVPSLKD